jgi:hypothetical protein
VNAGTDISACCASSEVATYACALGHYTRTIPRADVRRFSWSDLAGSLTHHEFGAKEGTCIVPAVFSGTRRDNADAQRIDVAILDGDAGPCRRGRPRPATAACGARGFGAVTVELDAVEPARQRALVEEASGRSVPLCLVERLSEAGPPEAAP